MATKTILDYFLNCMLLLVPILLWNWAFASRLPRAFSAEYFEKDIPVFITTAENLLRLVVFILPLFMPLNISTRPQEIGLWLYVLGVCLYFLSWLAQMRFPQSAWSKSVFGFLAPAYTPLIWLAGIGLVGSSLYFPIPYRSWMYCAAAILFLGFHVSHTLIVYLRTARS
jgi:hypothetical protein